MLGLEDASTRELISAGMNSIEVIVGAEPQDIADILSIDLEKATAIHEAAQRENEKAASIHQG